jgi:hypothetical protein
MQNLFVPFVCFSSMFEFWNCCPGRRFKFSFLDDYWLFEGLMCCLMCSFLPSFFLYCFCKHWLLIVGEKQPFPWEMRVRVAYYIAQALDQCNTENRKIYHDLNAYRVLFDEVSIWIVISISTWRLILDAIQ